MHRLAEQQQLRRVDALAAAAVQPAQQQLHAMGQPFVHALELHDRALLLGELRGALLQMVLLFVDQRLQRHDVVGKLVRIDGRRHAHAYNTASVIAPEDRS